MYLTDVYQMCLPQFPLRAAQCDWPETALGAPVWAVEGITQLYPACHSKARQPPSSFSGRRRPGPAGGMRAGLAGVTPSPRTAQW